MSTEQEQKEKVINLISAIAPETRIILYGSRARKSHREFSDLDLALDSGKTIDPQILLEISNVLNSLISPIKTDVVDLHDVSEQLKESILREGVVWKK